LSYVSLDSRRAPKAIVNIVAWAGRLEIRAKIIPSNGQHCVANSVGACLIRHAGVLTLRKERCRMSPC
jgi:hypothetical protein